METNHAAGNGYRGEDLNQLITELCGIRSEMVRIEKLFEGKTQQVHEKHKESARNFLHYLALRQARRTFAPAKARPLWAFVAGKVRIACPG